MGTAEPHYLRNGYGIYEQSYVALLYGSKMSAGLPSKNLRLGIYCFLKANEWGDRRPNFSVFVVELLNALIAGGWVGGGGPVRITSFVILVDLCYQITLEL